MDDLKDKIQNEGFKSRLGLSDEEQIRSLIKNMQGFAEKINTEGYDEYIQDKLGLNQKNRETIHLLAELIDDMMHNWNLGKFPKPKKRF
jgi:hypothetical protein